MIHFLPCWSIILISLISIWLLYSYLESTRNETTIYPYVLPKCCQPVEYIPLGGIPMSYDTESIGLCGDEDSDALLIPAKLFPEMSADTKHVKVELRNLEDGLQCDERPNDSDFVIDFTHLRISTPVSVGKTNVLSEFAFSGDNLLAPDGNIYSPGHYCISSGQSNKSHLTIKICKQTCSPRHLCIPRCCGGHQSILTSPPTSSNEEFLSFCSTPSIISPNNISWNPRQSRLVGGLTNETLFYQKKYVPREKHLLSQEKCELLRFTWNPYVRETPLRLLEDGRLQFIIRYRWEVSENFCIDGTHGISTSSLFGATEDNCEVPEREETVVAYVCPRAEIPPSIQTTSINNTGIIRLPACSCIARPPIQFFLLSTRLVRDKRNDRRDKVPVSLVSGENGGNLECPNGSAIFTVEFSSSDYENGLFEKDGSILLWDRLLPNEYCIRSLYHNAVRLRKCNKDSSLPWHMYSILGVPWYAWLIVAVLVLVFAFLVSFYLAIAVVYILRRDKEPVFRCSIFCFSISMVLVYFFMGCLLISVIFFIATQSNSNTVNTVFEILMSFFYVNAYSWMSVLCFDVWLNITYLRPGRKSTNRLWGYVAFTIILSSVSTAINSLVRIHTAYGTSLKKTMRYVWAGSALCLTCINFFIFLATAAKLWISKRSSDIQNQKNTFVLYFKLFLLVGLRWIIDFIYVFSNFVKEVHLILIIVTTILMFLHPIVLFFFLVWDAETKRYLETNYPRVKRAMDFLGGIGYPVRKCWGLCKSCRRPQQEVASGDEAIEIPLRSTNMYVHQGPTHNVPK